MLILQVCKDCSLPTSYRHVSFTSCFCKTMGCMVNCQLLQFLMTEINFRMLNVRFSAISPHLITSQTWATVSRIVFLCSNTFPTWTGLQHNFDICYPWCPPPVQYSWSATIVFLELSSGSSLPCSSWKCILSSLSQRKWTTTMNGFKCDPVHNSHQRDG